LWSFRATLDSLGRSADEEVLRHLIGPPLGESFRLLGIEASRIDDVVARYREFYAERGVYEAHLYDGVAQALEGLSREGVRLAVATAKRVDFARQMLGALGVADYFDAIEGATVDLRVTSKFDIMALAMAGWHRDDPAATWMVGDRHYDMIAARAHGAGAVGVTWGFGSRVELESAGAQWLIDEPGQLLDFDQVDATSAHGGEARAT